MYRSSLLIIICLSVLAYAWQLQVQPQPRVAFLDVGQGDATYIRTITGQDILIDGGPGRAVLQRLSEELPLFDETIELVILSHPDADHLSGLVEVLQRYKVETVITTALPATKPLHLEFTQLIADQEINHLVVYGGDHIEINASESIDVIYPFRDTPVASLETNDTSLTMEYHIQTNDTIQTIFFSGDMAETFERQLVTAGVLSDIDIYKVGHHGSKTSSSEELLAALQPEVCVIMVSKDNTYGHPTPEALNRLQPYCNIQRTDLEGTVTIPLD